MMTMSSTSMAMGSLWFHFHDKHHGNDDQKPGKDQSPGAGDTISVPEINLGGTAAVVALMGGILMVLREKKKA
ncbi:hypothetical Protein YC6258_00950 [Gynuella sunshinyii YC6258]|uniref:Uncharacterized protein n=2 Tax=Gynuella sunshinyii TaxID=1445505 RepID=A0A0C5V0A5_9GAMM|nr:hypothetical Protein YC6258_00950 [Gynuella sunshinyii YC6258]